MEATSEGMSQETVTSAIHAAGYSIGTCSGHTGKGLQYVVTARDAKTNEEWTVLASSEYGVACDGDRWSGVCR